MKGNEFLEMLELIDPAYIEAADSAGKPQKTYWRPLLLGAAACIGLLLVLTLTGILGKQGKTLPGPSVGQNVSGNGADAGQNTNSIGYSNDPGFSGQLAKEEQEDFDSNKNSSERNDNKQKEDEGQEGQEGQKDTSDNSNSSDNQDDGPAPVWNFTYNEADFLTATDNARRYIPGYFTQELGEKELLAIGPGKQIGWMEFSGFAGFDGEGKLLEVHLTTDSTLPDSPIQISFSEEPIFSCVLLSEEEAVSSYCNGIDFLLYQYTSDFVKQEDASTVSLYAEANINELYYLFHMEALSGQSEQAKADFEALLECFTFYQTGAAELASITPEEIPEWFDRTLTWQEAGKETDFGAWFLPAVPDGFQEESIRRYKDQNFDYLSGLWTKGYDSLWWEVHAYGTSDAARLTGTADTENYDLSLYPIPRAESVPDKLREIVDNPVFKAEELTLEAVYARAYRPADTGDSDGWRMNFSVRYGEIVVKLYAKGLSPEWIYQQLQELLKQ